MNQWKELYMATLCKLTENNISALTGRKICCVEKSVSYLEELCQKFDVLDQIECVADANQRNLGQFTFHGKDIDVVYISYLINIDFDETAIVITSDYVREVFETICGVLKRDCSDVIVYYFANRETEMEEHYREKYADAALQNIIVFRSGPHASSYVKGMDFGDNARALFEYALQVGLNRTYELVWLVKNPEEFKQYESVEHVSFLSYDWSISEKQEERDAYYRALCLAKYLFFTDAYGFARNCRKDQVRVQLWHGCGFKTRVNFVRCEKRYEFTTVISDLYADIHADIYGLRREQVLVTGYAKQDWLFHPQKEDMTKLQIPEAGKYIFWLPTFRSTERKLEQLNEYILKSETGLPVVNTQKQLHSLNALLVKKDVVLIVKLHPFQNRREVFCDGCSNIYLLENDDLVEQDIPINRLLGQADALISDYSSAAVDFMLLDKPIAFMLEDVEEYEKSRGFVFEKIRDWLPGKEIFTVGDVCGFVEEVADGQDTTGDRRRSLRNKMHQFCDDKNCQRILEEFGLESDIKVRNSYGRKAGKIAGRNY